MESLFARHTPKRGRVILMLVGSLLVHGGLVGIGALLVRPEPTKVDVDWTPIQVDGPLPLNVTDPVEPQTTVETAPTATPDDVVETLAVTPPPVVDDPLFAEPSSPTPRQRSLLKPVMTPQTTSVRTSSSTPTTPGAGIPGVPGGNQSAGVTTWVMPHPPYPAAARRLVSTSGLTTIRITTDATGHVSNVVIVRSAGNPVLDAHTVSYVRENWHGPANASRTTEFLYQLR